MTVLLAGLVLLAYLDPAVNGRSLCPLDRLDLFCPGEGLGRSISYLFRGLWSESVASHPAGVAALPLIGFRIVHLFRKNILSNPQSK